MRERLPRGFLRGLLQAHHSTNTITATPPRKRRLVPPSTPSPSPTRSSTPIPTLPSNSKSPYSTERGGGGGGEGKSENRFCLLLQPYYYNYITLCVSFCMYIPHWGCSLDSLASADYCRRGKGGSRCINEQTIYNHVLEFSVIIIPTR